MKLTSRARHAVRLALEVSRRECDKRPIQLAEIARVTGLSQKFLEQLAIALKSHSLLRGVAGRHGGYLLARPANEITIGQVLTAVLGPIDLSVCTGDPSICINAEFCECRIMWALLRHRINKVLNEFTLADLEDKKLMSSMIDEIQEDSYEEPKIHTGRGA